MKTVLVSGAGISADAGIPTYRGSGGYWSDEKFEFMSHYNRYGNYLPELIPRWVEMAIRTQTAEPTKFHKYAAEQGWGIITQNVDSLHYAAGSQNVIEIHGSFRSWRTLRGGKKVIQLDEVLSMSPQERLRLKTVPNIVLFGDTIRKGKEAMDMIRRAGQVIYAGTSGKVYPVADWHTLNPNSLLINKEKWGDFKEFFIGSTHDYLNSTLY